MSIKNELPHSINTLNRNLIFDIDSRHLEQAYKLNNRVSLPIYNLLFVSAFQLSLYSLSSNYCINHFVYVVNYFTKLFHLYVISCCKLYYNYLSLT